MSSVVSFIEKMGTNFNYVIAVLLFTIGLYAVVVKNNLIKKFMGLNIMETACFLLYISLGAVNGGKAPIWTEGLKKSTVFVNPIPQALILTGIVVAVSTTSLALSLMIKIYEHCGTLDAEKLKTMETE
jgi:multicomponent Na+:H+ antiporter subunit C